MTTTVSVSDRRLEDESIERRDVAQQTVYVVLPAYNEQEALGAAFASDSHGARRRTLAVQGDRRRRWQPGCDALVASKATFVMPVELVEHEVNQGLAAAIRTGLTAALDRCGPNDVIVTMDADNTHPPQLIPGMLAKIGQGFDVVIASRFQPGAKVHGVPPSRQLYSVGGPLPVPGHCSRSAACAIIRAAIGPIAPTRLRLAVEKYGDQLISETGFSCMADLLLKLQRLPLKMAEVPLELHYERRGTGSKMRVGRTIRQTLSLLVRRRFGLQ